MQFYPQRPVEAQANRLPKELREAYIQSQMDRIEISDGTETIELTGYAEYSYLEEKSYTTQPVRTMDGQINEIEEYETFLTPRLIIKYNMMGIEDYRKTMKMLKKRNGFLVTCYDIVENKRVTNQMYVAPPSMPIIYQQYLMALGIKEYVIELIGTGVAQDQPIQPNTVFSIDYSYVGWDTTTYEVPQGTTWRYFVENYDAFLKETSGAIVLDFNQDAAVCHPRSDKLVNADEVIEALDYYVDVW